MAPANRDVHIDTEHEMKFVLVERAISHAANARGTNTKPATTKMCSNNFERLFATKKTSKTGRDNYLLSPIYRVRLQ